MAVAPASMADSIIVLDDEEEESARPSCSTASSSSSSSASRQAKNVSPLRAEQPASTHISRSPFASAKKDRHVVQAENQRLFTEFVEHCSTVTQDCPEVLTFLQTKHNKASPDFLSSVEFRNTLGRCLTRAQSNHSKTFVYINELCTVLRQHTIKKRLSATKLEPGPSTSAPPFLQSTSGSLKKDTANIAAEADGVITVAEDEQPSTSGLQEDREESKAAQQQEEKKAQRASRRQIAYLENLLRVYNHEIRRLQEAELSLDDMGTEDSSYLQEHKLKRKMMKIYYKLCELKGCSKLTGRVIEHKITFSGTRYPEVNKKIERFINSEEAHRNPPDYQDILQVVLRTNQRYNLDLSRKHMNQMAQDAFRDTGSRMQDRRHLDLVYNFGSHLTESYKPAIDPALSDTSLLRRLRSNREVALSHLDEVISKYAVKQEDTEEQERSKRKEKEGKSEKEGIEPKVNGVKGEEKEEEEDDDEDDESSDPDIEDEIQASTQHNGAGADDEEDDNEAEQADDGTEEEQGGKMLGSVTAEEEGGKEKGTVTSGLSPLSDESGHRISPVSDISSPRDSPSQSEPALTEDKSKLPNGDLAGTEEPADSSNQASVVLVSTTLVSKVPAGLSANRDSLPPSPAVIPANKEPCDTQITNGRSPPRSPRATRSRKRKREEISSKVSQNKSNICDSGVEISLDMGVISCSPPLQAESTRPDTPVQELVSSSQTTPPPKKNKVNVATQCDPDEIIVLSDSE
ncbi:death domain-associated protein 6 isoform X2 [Genypterus blacodes]|uniref:death domain-associated protein 6 isoform X2 n=1 Tax=Genypterus blacodes TaxID=154954 RepID=UPI003F76B357